jgi:hypothetical protein
MRLLDTRTFKLNVFFDEYIPPYVILSHTWDQPEEEVTYQDLEDIERAQDKEGFRKIEGCCAQARRDGFDWIWIDTCCINKESSAELSEAINSMFHWYRDSHMCYAFLSDVHSNATKMTEPLPRDFPSSRWFTRGWTLQELLAPHVLYMFNTHWEVIGTKLSLASVLQSITGIPVDVLRGKSVSECCVAEIMSWARYRRTTRVEDMAYSLLGLFNINMPLLYGEREKAFIRLQEEILKNTGDYSLFAWTADELWTNCIFAHSPRHFQFAKRDDDFGFAKGSPMDHTSVKPPLAWANVLELGIRLGPQREDGYFPAYLNCKSFGALVCMMVKPNTGLGRHVWTRSSALTLIEDASLSQFESQRLCFHIIPTTAPRSMDGSDWTVEFAFKRLPPCLTFILPASDDAIEALDSEEKGLRIDSFGLAHLFTDGNDITTIQMAHRAHPEVEHDTTHSSPENLVGTISSEIREHSTRERSVVSSSGYSKREGIIKVLEAQERVDLNLSMAGFQTRTTACHLRQLFRNQEDEQDAGTPSNSSDSCYLVLKEDSPHRSGGCLLTTTVKPAPSVIPVYSSVKMIFFVKVSCSILSKQVLNDFQGTFAKESHLRSHSYPRSDMLKKI